ncbi:MAG: AMP-binding protein [Candidatus Omnitrophota bacterium]
MNLVITEYFSRIAHKFSGRVCLQIKKGSVWERWTYGQLEERALKVAGFLIAEGLKKGDFACLILENRPEWPAIYLGIVRAGLSCVPLDPQLSSDEIKNLILDSGAKIVFTSCEIFAQKVKQVIEQADVEAVVLETDEIKIKNTSYENINWPEVNPSDTASLIYTSGTTGKPKGVMLTHKNICANFMSIQKTNLCSPSDNFLSILPLYHTYAFMVTLIVPLFLGAKVTYALSFKSQEFSRIIGEASVTILVGVPQLFSLLHKAIFDKIKKIHFFLRPLFLPLVKLKLRRQFGSLRLCVSGGARLEPEVASDLSKLGLKLIEGYGLTETSPVVTINPTDKVKFGSVGKPIPDVEIKISNPDRKGVGEVLIKGPNVMEGYFKQPELTAQAIKEDWFHSGDLGYIDKEGYLFLVGREKEVIVLASGKNIYPEELEEYYLKSPYIKEICITHKEEKIFGYLKDSLFAVIVPDLEYFSQKKELNIHEKIRWDLETLGKNLSLHQHIMGFTLTKEELPRTALRKLKRYAVREKYLPPHQNFWCGGLQAEPSGVEVEKMVFSKEDLAILNKDIAKSIIQYVSREVNKPVNLNSHLEIDLGIDSLTRVELGLGLEAIFKINIPDEILYKVSTIRDAIINLEDLMQSRELKKEKAKEKTWSEILKEPPPEEIIKKIKIDFGFYESAVTWLLKNIFLFILRLFWFLRIKGRENLPQQGPYLICSNHASYLDGLFIFSSLPFKQSLNIYFLGYQHIFEHPSLFWANKVCRFISIDVSSHLTLSMQAISFALSHKKIVCIFPEGMRSIDGEVKEFKKGVGILLKELDIPVIPVYIQGSHRSWPRGTKFPRPHPIKVIFGKPLYAQQLGNDYETIAKRLRGEVLKLIPKNAKS